MWYASSVDRVAGPASSNLEGHLEGQVLIMKNGQWKQLCGFGSGIGDRYGRPWWGVLGSLLLQRHHCHKQRCCSSVPSPEAQRTGFLAPPMPSGRPPRRDPSLWGASPPPTPSGPHPESRRSQWMGTSPCTAATSSPRVTLHCRGSDSMPSHRFELCVCWSACMCGYVQPLWNPVTLHLFTPSTFLHASFFFAHGL